MAVKTLEKNSILKYFEILKDKFFKIILLNAIFFTVFTISILAIMGLSAGLHKIFGEIHELWTLIEFLPLVLLSPFVAAIMKMMRDYVREEPGFFVEDFKKAFKDNFKQSLIIGILQYIVIWIIIISSSFYYSLLDLGIFYTLGLAVTFFVALAILFSSYYVYMMTVTLKLKVKELIKNSLIFTMLCFLRNILLTVVLAIWCALNAFLAYIAITSGRSLIFGLVLCVFMVLTFGIIFYTIAFFTFPPIKKYILDPYYEEHPEESSKSIIDKPSVDEIDFNANDEEKDLPEFVYHNGRMVHRNALNEDSVFSDERILPENND